MQKERYLGGSGQRDEAYNSCTRDRSENAPSEVKSELWTLVVSPQQYTVSLVNNEIRCLGVRARKRGGKQKKKRGIRLDCCIAATLPVANEKEKDIHLQAMKERERE